MQYLVCPGSADDMIWSIVNSKLQVVGTTLDGNTAGTAAGACSYAASNTAGSYCHISSKNTTCFPIMLVKTVKMQDSCCNHGRSAVRILLLVIAHCFVALRRSQDHIH